MGTATLYKSPDVVSMIKLRAKEQNVAIKEMLASVGLGINTLSHMNHGKAIAFDSLARIADYLDCSVDYLLGREEQVKKPAPGKGGELSESALRFAALVDRLTPAQQELLLCQLQAWTAQNQQQGPAALRSAGGTDPKSDS